MVIVEMEVVVEVSMEVVVMVEMEEVEGMHVVVCDDISRARVLSDT